MYEIKYDNKVKGNLDRNEFKKLEEFCRSNKKNYTTILPGDTRYKIIYEFIDL